MCAGKWLVLKDQYFRRHLHLVAACEVMALRWDRYIYVCIIM